MLNKLTQNYTEEQLQHLTDIFVACSKYEMVFKTDIKGLMFLRILVKHESFSCIYSSIIPERIRP